MNEESTQEDPFVLRMRELMSACAHGKGIEAVFVRRLMEGRPTRDENPESHFCVYFAAYDPKSGRVFFGLHKKSGLWLFNGGHVDRGELPEEALRREIVEEWGPDTAISTVEMPQLLTVTEIDNLPMQTCRAHYNIWFFVSVDERNFRPDSSRMDTEFSEFGWHSLEEARGKVTDGSTLEAISLIERDLLRNT
ncbi:hypothetical protein A2480_00085 [Candidatus Uhrbacteria bacterium RIFOXYC2_FULL_47_19]|uniref:Nudix hydrolase domain-containing protein n=1 Tax=Candidatus Uhrbacteria bacterium RIFOXYC2_FULL_47_19 TaxID=1802424 RepID=A0A1F7WFR6_9BACT|nr:MAG: hypothetical protein A2480_00085 [Candidatus Uhrbacteria bacterium RIFOXYC2_FULL_47_19]HCC22339.1 hypothetical protein [Candidatus Uhrbacteria bacterium]